MTDDPFLTNEKNKFLSQTNTLMGKIRETIDELLNSLEADGSKIKFQLGINARYNQLKNTCNDIYNRCFEDNASCEIGNSVRSLHDTHVGFFHALMDYSGFTHTSDDNIAKLSMNISRDMGCIHSSTMKIVPGVTNMLLYYRNNVSHNSSKVFIDPLTGVQIGHVCNTYMLSAMGMFTAYSILELLMTWAGFMDIELSYNVYNALKND